MNNNDKPPMNGPAQSTRRTFLKKAAGTVLLFGIGLQIHQARAAQDLGQSLRHSCYYKGKTEWCDSSFVTGLDGSKGYFVHPPDPSGCSEAQEWGEANCRLITSGPRACARALGANMSGEHERAGDGWCAW